VVAAGSAPAIAIIAGLVVQLPLVLIVLPALLRMMGVRR
jgi:hypothetical protein